MNGTMCFVCDESVAATDMSLCVAETHYSKITFPDKISELMGDGFVVVVSEDDKVCKRCAALINRLDKLEEELSEIKRLVSEFLSEKYSLNSDEHSSYTVEGLEFSEEGVDYEETVVESSLIKDLGDDYMLDENQLLIPSSGTKSKLKNTHDFEIVNGHHTDSNPVLVKTETFQDNCKMLTSISQINADKSESLECKDRPRNLSANNSTVNNTLFASSHGNTMSCSFHEDIFLDNVKKEKDVLYHDSVNSPCDSKQSKNTEESCEVLSSFFSNKSDAHFDFKYEETIDYTDNDESPTSPPPHIDKKNVPVQSPCENSLVNSEENKVLLIKSAGKTRNVTKHKTTSVTNHPVTKFKPILPKISSYSLVSTQIKNSLNRDVYTRPRNKKLENHKDKEEKISQRKSLEKHNLCKDSTKNVLIKTEAKCDQTSVNYICKLCKTEFKSECALKNHLEQHLKEELCFSCCFCPRTFKSRSGLYEHTASNHTKKFRFCCDICGQGFTNQSRLEEHHCGHTKEQRLVCDVCGKKFSSRGTYWIHRKWHFDPLPYKCSECGQLFKHSSSLSVHRRRRHTGERPYKCHYCALTFNVSGTFKRHLILHTKNYPYNCDLCKQGFTTRFKYSEHMAKVHSIVVDKPSVERKDCKMAVYDDEVASANDCDILLRNNDYYL